MRSSILIVFFIGLLIIGSTTSVFGAQLEARIVPDAESAKMKITFQRNIFIDYQNGGDLANELKTKTWKVNVQADSSNPAVQDLINKLNQKIKNDGSAAQITDLGVEFSAELIGRETNTSIDYKIVLTPTLSHYNIRKYSSNNPSLVDMGWRGLSVIGPITIDGVEINMPISVLKSKEPAAYEIIAGTEGESLLSQNIMNADGIRDQPLGNWHDLFDATGINVDASTFGLDKSISGFVVHTFTMGQTSIREGRQVEKEFEVTFTKDTEYTIRAVESADSATVAVIGFAAIGNLGGAEGVGVTPKAPKDYGETTGGGFPIMIIYGMAAMAGIGAIAILVRSEERRVGKECRSRWS